MATNIINYSSFDFATIKADLRNKLATDAIFSDYDFAGSNINEIIELSSGLGDFLNYYINVTANESFIGTADIYENINRLVELVGYNPNGVQSSQVTVNVSATFISNEDDDYFTIPNTITLTSASTTSNGQTILFSPVSSLTFVAISGINTFSVDLPLVQGQRISTVNFTGDGTSFQRYEIPDPNAIEQYVQVLVGGNNGTNAVEWDYVENIYATNQTNVFSTRYDENQLVQIQFGNSSFGGVPPVGANINISYITSLGLSGAIGSNQLISFDSNIYLIDAQTGLPYTNPITFVVTQNDASVGQAAPLTVDEIRNYAPRYYRAQNRLVTQQDHQDLILTGLPAYVQQVVAINQDDYDALVVDLSGTPGFNITNFPYYGAGSYNTIYMYILPVYGYTVNNTLKTTILNYISQYQLLTLNYIILDIDYVNVYLNITYEMTATTTNTITEIQNNINTAIRNYFSKNNFTLGDELKYSDLITQLAQSDTGIDSLTLAISSDITSGWQYQNIDFNSIQFPIIPTNSTIITLVTG